MFGHGLHAHQRVRTKRAPYLAHTVAPVEAEIIEETPAEIIKRFFLEVMRPSLNQRVRSIDGWSAYVQWCNHCGIEAVSHAMFGRLSQWRKDRIGGSVWYLDAELTDGYGDLAQKVRALPARTTRVSQPSEAWCHGESMMPE